MSFIITVHTNEGIIMASDSRTTYSTTSRLSDGTVKRNIGVQITDTSYKTFLCNRRVGISTCGTASINEMPIAGYIEKFISEKITEKSTVEDIANDLLTYFSQYSPLPDTNFIVAGYNEGDNKQYIRRVYVESGSVIPVGTDTSGAVWDGETDILQRIIKNVGLKQQDDTYLELKDYCIGFNYFTLQDAVDFAQFAVDTTIKTMFFQNRVKTVGGPIDILAIKPSGSFWIQRKELHA